VSQCRSVAVSYPPGGVQCCLLQGECSVVSSRGSAVSSPPGGVQCRLLQGECNVQCRLLQGECNVLSCSSHMFTCSCSSHVFTCSCSSHVFTCSCSSHVFTCSCSSHAFTCSCSSHVFTWRNQYNCRWSAYSGSTSRTNCVFPVRSARWRWRNGSQSCQVYSLRDRYRSSAKLLWSSAKLLSNTPPQVGLLNSWSPQAFFARPFAEDNLKDEKTCSGTRNPLIWGKKWNVLQKVKCETGFGVIEELRNKCYTFFAGDLCNGNYKNKHKDGLKCYHQVPTILSLLRKVITTRLQSSSAKLLSRIPINLQLNIIRLPVWKDQSIRDDSPRVG